MTTAGTTFFRKIAQGLGDIANQAAEGQLTAAQSRNGRVYDNPQNFEGQTSGGQLLSGLMTSILGETGGAVTGIMLPFLNPMLRERGIDLQNPYELYPSGSTAQRNISLQKLKAAQSVLLENNGDAVKQVAAKSSDKLLEILGKMVPGGLPASARAGVQQWINSSSPTNLGMTLQMIGAAVPELKSTMASFGPPGFLLDPTPLANAMLARNKGVWNDNDFQSMYQQYNKAYQSGAFKGVPGQFAVAAIQHAAEQGAQDPVSAGANLSSAARSFQESGAAPEFGDALQLATQIDPNSINDPTKAVRYAQWIGQNSGSGYVNPLDYAAAARMSREQGIPLAAAMSSVSQGRRAQDAYRLNPTVGAQASQEAAGAYSRGGMSPTLKLLQAAMGTDDNLGLQIDAAMKRGDGATLHSLAMQAARNPVIRRNARGADPSQLMSKMDPDAYKTVMQRDAQDFAARTGNPQLQRLFQNNGRLDLAMKGNLKGLNYNTVQFLQSQPGRSAMSTAVVSALPSTRPPIDTTAITTPAVGKRTTFDYPKTPPTPPAVATP